MPGVRGGVPRLARWSGADVTARCIAWPAGAGGGIPAAPVATKAARGATSEVGVQLQAGKNVPPLRRCVKLVRFQAAGKLQFLAASYQARPSQSRSGGPPGGVPLVSNVPQVAVS